MFSWQNVKNASAKFLSAEGPLVQHLPGFKPRAQQEIMAQVVEHSLAQNKALIIEAATGVGKTFAYLVPALLSGRKVIVSTGTRHLRDQLYHRDLPIIRAALDKPVKTALLKGRANYLCLHRLENAHAQIRAPALLDKLSRIRKWAGCTRSGDIGEVCDIAEDSIIWQWVTSTTDNCLGVECPLYQRCHVVQARRAAQEAELVVINHHLFFADLALKETGFAELLPSATAFIMDEAHQLPEIASNFFGLHLSSHQLLELARDTRAEHTHLPRLSRALEHAAADLRNAMGAIHQRGRWSALRQQSEITAALDQLAICLSAMCDGLLQLTQRGKGLQNCARRASEIMMRLQMLRADSQDSVQWFETSARGFFLHHTPLEVAESFSKHMQNYSGAWVFTSATLAVGDSFEHFTSRLGLSQVQCERLDSPYDFARSALLYRPRGLPEPGSPMYTRAVVEAAMPVLNASRGRGFMLFTSHRALNEAASLLTGRMKYPLLVQGNAPRHELLEQFRGAGNAVLLGTTSFWEGVDVRGPALSCVIIDKLPFASPIDPVLQARLAALTARGGDPFMDFQLPQAVIILRQGVGRLIRDEQDTGVLMICDPRLSTRAYGSVFLNSLPDVLVTRELTDVECFLNAT